MSDIESDQEGNGKRPRIYKDRSGNRYVKNGKKRITAPKNVTDAAFLKWLIKYLRPKRKQRTALAPKQAATKPRLYDPHALTSDQAADPSVRNYVNIERTRAGLDELDAPVAPGLPPTASADTIIKREDALEEKKEAAKTKRSVAAAAKKATPEYKAAEAKVDATIKAAEEKYDEKLVALIKHPIREMGGITDLIKNAPVSPAEREAMKSIKGVQRLLWLLGVNSTPIVNKYKEQERLMKLQAMAGTPVKVTRSKKGKGAGGDGEGMTTTQINDQMDVYRPRYLGAIARNEWGVLTTPPRGGKSGWIMNTDPNTKPGQHWVAFLMDLDGHTIEYYDSFAGKIPNDILDDLKKFIAKNNPTPEYLKMKENRIVDQDANSTNCGWFCIKFLRDRFRGNSFREVTKYDDHVKGEKDIEKLKEQLGGAFDIYL